MLHPISTFKFSKPRNKSKLNQNLVGKTFTISITHKIIREKDRRQTSTSVSELDEAGAEHVAAAEHDVAM